MRTFYIFKINNDYYKITKNMPYNLYKALLNIKLGTKENITYLKNEYNSLVDKYNKRELNKYIYGKMSKLDGYNLFNSVHTFNSYYTNEASKLIVNNSYMILKTNTITPYFLDYLEDIPNLFLIDFEKGDYFYLSNLVNI
ncbi:MAG: hypothetical protein MR765_02235 [Tenericutes bacterium]|nr:hypothetical protein [Mycoplasmatota bacterium]